MTRHLLIALMFLAAGACSQAPTSESTLDSQTTAETSQPSTSLAEDPSSTTALPAASDTADVSATNDSLVVSSETSTQTASETTPTTAAPTTVPPATTVTEINAGLDVEYESFEMQRYRIEFGVLTIESFGATQRAYLDTVITYKGDSAGPTLFDLTIGLANSDGPIGDWWFQPCLDDGADLMNPGAKPDQTSGRICIEAPNLDQATHIVVTPLVDPPLTLSLP